MHKLATVCCKYEKKDIAKVQQDNLRQDRAPLSRQSKAFGIAPSGILASFISYSGFPHPGIR